MATDTTNLGLKKPELADQVKTHVTNMATNMDTIDTNIHSVQTEVSNARVSVSSAKTYDTLKARLDGEIGNLSKLFVSIDQFPIISPETDDSGRIIRARDYISDNGAIFFPSKTAGYNVSQKISFMKNGLKIFGQNVKSTIINFTTTDACFELVKDPQVAGNHIYDVIVEGIQFRGGGVAKKALLATYVSQCYFNNLEVNNFTEYGIDMQYGSINTMFKVSISNCAYGIRITQNAQLNLYSMNMYMNTVADFKFEGESGSINCNALWSEEQKIVFYADDANGNVTIDNLVVQGYISADPTYDSLIAKFSNPDATKYISVKNFSVENTKIYMPDSNFLFDITFPGVPHASSIINISCNKNTIRKPLTAVLKANNNKARLIYGNNVESSAVTLLQGTALIGGIDSGGTAYTPANKVNGSFIFGSSTVASSVAGETQWYNSIKSLGIHNGTTFEYFQTSRNGATADRPTSVLIGQQYYDTTKGRPTWFTGSAWMEHNRWVSVPASATATGQPGDIAADASYLYICHAVNTWKRVAIAAW